MPITTSKKWLAITFVVSLVASALSISFLTPLTVDAQALGDIDDDDDGILNTVESPVGTLVSWPVLGTRPDFQDGVAINAPDFVESGVTVTGGPSVSLALTSPVGFFGFYSFDGATPGDVEDARTGGHWIEASFTTGSDFVDGGVRIVSLAHTPRSNVPYRYTAAISDDGFATETVLASDHSWQVGVPPLETEFVVDPDTTYEIRWYTHNSTDQIGNPNVNGTGHRFDGLRLDFVEDSDGDGLQNSLDLDSDNDGIPDNVEAQTTQNYIAPVYTDSDGNGLLDVYESVPGGGEGLPPVNTDLVDEPDYLDTDTDNDGVLDIVESGQGLTDANTDGRTDGPVGLNGLDNAAVAESVDDYSDVNGQAHNNSIFILDDTDNDTDDDGNNAAPLNIDFDWRDGDPPPALTTSLLVDKSFASHTDAASGTPGNVDATFAITVTNTGTADVDALVLTDDLDDQFGASFIGVVGAPVVTGDLTAARANTGFDGDADINLITADAVEAMAAGESFTTTFIVEIDPDADLAVLPLENVANAGGGGEGPFPNPPEPVEVPSLFPAKDIVEQDVAASGVAGNLDVTYRIVVLNNGSEPATGIELIDDVVTQLGTAFAGVTAAPVVNNIDSTTPPVANANYDGTGDLLDGSAVNVEPGQSFTVDFTVEINPNADDAPGVLGNLATVTGTTPSGPIPPRETVTGLDPETGPPGPVILDVPRIAGIETIDADNNGDGTYSVAFTVEAVNTGATRLDNISLDLDLDDTFTGADSWTLEAVTSDDFTVSAAYDGTNDIDLVAADVNSLEVGESGTVAILVTLVPGTGGSVQLPDDADLSNAAGSDGPDDDSAEARVLGAFVQVGVYVTQFLASGWSPDGLLVSDLSGVTLDDNLPLEFELVENIDLTAAKEAVSTTVTDERMVELTYRVRAGNAGNVEIQNLQITDDLQDTFDGLSFDVTAISSTDFTVNPDFDGSGDTNLLAGSDTLTIGAVGSVEFTVIVDTSTLTEEEITLENIAFASGNTPTGEPTETPTTPGSIPVTSSGEPTPTTVTVDIPRLGLGEPPAALAFTGVEPWGLALFAVLLLAAGLLALGVNRRRTDQTPA